jgi:adenylate kinase
VVIVLLGPPGAGKGTQAPVLAEWFGVPILASGDLLRAVAASPTALGREVAAIMQRGDLVPDEATVRIFLDRLDQPDAAGGAILDGFPRTRWQAEALDQALAERSSRVDAAVLIDVPAEDLVARMTSRLICRAGGHVYNVRTNPPRTPGVCDHDGTELYQRADDAEETVRARLAAQLEPLAAVVAHYREAGVLSVVDGRQPIDAVTGSVLAALPAPTGEAAAE